MPRRVLGLVVLSSLCWASGALGDERLAQALLVEWIVANCDQGEIPALTVMAAGMVIDGSDPAAVTERRGEIRKGVAENYPDPNHACEQLLDSMK